jgi:hypothetical protein
VTPPYVFANNSFDQSPPPTSNISNVTSSAGGYPNDTINGGDQTFGGSSVTLSSDSHGALLALLPLTTATAVTPTSGDTFIVSLVPTSDPDGSGNFPSGFQSGETFSAFSSTSGTVTIIASTVPEPASWIIGLIAVAGLGIGIVRRSRTAR